MEKISLNSEIISRSVLCSAASAIILSLLVLLGQSYFSFLLLIVYFLLFLFAYLIIASPIQVKLNQQPKKFSIKYLVIYLIASALINAIIKIVGSGNPFTSSSYYFIFISSSLIFWIVDSFLLQDTSVD